MPKVTVVVPTLEERENLVPFLSSVEGALAGVDYEVMFVDDDSRDGTAALAREIAERNRRVRVVQRMGRRGLSSAVLEGMMASSSPYLAVMDSDLQHDEKILPAMLQKLEREELDLVIATRHEKGGGMGDMASHRKRLSEWGRRLSAVICRTPISDPMSGYFAVTREYVNEVAHRLSGTGFKVLLDLIVSSRRPVRVGEVPYHFRQRLHGRSKLDILVGMEYVELLADKLIGDYIPVSYVLFGCVGAVGIVVHLAAVTALRRIPGFNLADAQVTSSVIVIGANFLLNNQVAFRAEKLRGARLLFGMALFYMACSVGLFLNVRVLEHLRAASVPWYAAAAGGLAVGSVWNYWVSSMLIWRVRRRSRASRSADRAAAA